MGRIVTFYSYKGGTGRSMALANVAWALASHNYRVLLVDWDLEAPGLHRYFRPFLVDPELTAPESTGLIDFVRSFADRAATPPTSTSQPADWYRPFADIGRWAIPLRSPEGPALVLGERGEIRLVPAGRQDADYPARVNSFAWDRLYAEQSGGAFFEAVRESMRSYDFVLIDSRTGVSDTSGICTMQMPDALVVCYTYNIQSIEGASNVARTVRRRRPDLPIFPVAMRAEYQQEDLLKQLRRFARRRFGEFVSDGDEYFDRIEVPYLSQYAYWERLAAFDDRPASKSSINTEMSLLAHYVSGRTIGIVPADDRLKQQVARNSAHLMSADEDDEEDDEDDDDDDRAEPRRGEIPRTPVSPGLLLGRLAAGAAVALLAVSIAWSLLRLPSPAVQRTRLLALAVAKAPIASVVGVLLDPGIVDTPESRALYRTRVAPGVPVFLQGAVTRSHRGSLDPSGQWLLTCDVQLRVWSTEGRALVPAVALPESAVDCVPFAQETAALVLTSRSIDLFQWSKTQAQPPARMRSWRLPERRYTRIVLGASSLEAVVFDVGRSVTASVVQLGDSGTASIVGSLEFDESLSSPETFATRTEFVFSALRPGAGDATLALTRRPYGTSVRSPSAIRGWTEMVRIPYSPTIAFAIDSSGSRAATFAIDKIFITDLASGKAGPATTLGTSVGTFVDAVAFDPSDQWIAFATNDQLELRSIANLGLTHWKTPLPAAESGLPRIDIRDKANVIATSSEFGTVLFRRDRPLPNENAPWPELVRGLRAATTLCMAAEARQSLFRESAEAARAAFDECETQHGRPPAPPPKQ